MTESKDTTLGITEEIDSLKVENLKLKRYLKGMVKTLQNNMEVPIKNFEGVENEIIVVTRLPKYGTEYLKFQTMPVNITEEIK